MTQRPRFECDFPSPNFSQRNTRFSVVPSVTPSSYSLAFFYVNWQLVSESRNTVHSPLRDMLCEINYHEISNYTLSLIPSTQFVMPRLLWLILLLFLCLLPYFHSVRTLQFGLANHITSYFDTKKTNLQCIEKAEELNF